MLSPQEQQRYGKQIALPEIGSTGQQKLKAAKVLVVGAGGLGCPILQYLAAAGVGNIGIADGDKVEISNLQRQVLYTDQEIGQHKAEVAKRKLSALNNHVSFQIFPVFVDSSNVLDILRDYDIVVDGSDNFSTRYLVNDACVILNKVMVSGAIYKYEGQVSVFNYQGGPTYRCIFPEPPGAGESPNCAEIGVVASLPGIIGTIQANEVIKIITGIGEVLSGKLLVMDTLSMQTRTFSFRLNEANLRISTLQDMPQYCEPAARAIAYEELRSMLLGGDVQLIDVREVDEHIISNIGGQNIPLSQFANSTHLFSSDKPIVLYCAMGIRSAHAAKLLLQMGYTNIYNLRNGISHLQLS